MSDINAIRVEVHVWDSKLAYLVWNRWV